MSRRLKRALRLFLLSFEKHETDPPPVSLGKLDQFKSLEKRHTGFLVTKFNQKKGRKKGSKRVENESKVVKYQWEIFYKMSYESTTV